MKAKFKQLTMSQNLPEQANPQKILIVDDHELILDGTLDVLSKQYPLAEIITVQTAQDTLAQVQKSQPDLAVIDLSIPEKSGMIAQIEIGIQLIKDLMNKYPFLNLMVQSSYVKALVRIRHEIDSHQGGFAVVDKGLSKKEMLIRVNLALQGGTHTKDLGKRIEVKPEWLEVIRLASEEGLQDRAIAERMNMCERTVRNHWTKIQDVLGIYPEDRKNLRIETINHARVEGLID